MNKYKINFNIQGIFEAYADDEIDALTQLDELCLDDIAPYIVSFTNEKPIKVNDKKD